MHAIFEFDKMVRKRENQFPVCSNANTMLFLNECFPHFETKKPKFIGLPVKEVTRHKIDKSTACMNSSIHMIESFKNRQFILFDWYCHYSY